MFSKCRPYEGDIERAAITYWLDFPKWRWWEAQIYQESRCNPRAVSPVGAQGLAQIMPRTFADLARGDVGLSPFDARTSITLGAVYMAQRRLAWGAAGRTGEQRNALGQAAYNAGMGNILKAQAACAGARLWPAIAPCLPGVTGERNAHETTTYISNIARWHGQLSSD